MRNPKAAGIKAFQAKKIPKKNKMAEPATDGAIKSFSFLVRPGRMNFKNW